jgi:hypothetical protein
MQETTLASKAADYDALSPANGSIGTVQPRPWLQDTTLWILLLGPLVAPVFVVIGWPVLRPFADGIYLLGEVVCPKVDVHLMFLGEPMAVCSSCWAAVWGLWAVRLLYGREGDDLGRFGRLNLAPFWVGWHRVPPLTKLGVLAVGFVPWTLDVALYDLGVWSSPHIFMMLAGFLGGLVAGALLLPAASEMRQRTLRKNID